MTTHVKRAFKYRFCPTEAWTLRSERVNHKATSAMLTAWTKTEEPAFLNDVSSVPLQQALGHLQSRKPAEYTSSAFRFRDGRVTPAKTAEPLDIVWSRPLPEGAAPSTVTVSQDPAGRWYVSMLVEDPTLQPLPANGRAVGVDAGLDHLQTPSTGEKVTNPRHERRDRARLAKAKTTTRLVRENQVVVIEDLTVRNRRKHRPLSRAISDAAWSDFRSMAECKAAWYGREVIAVDRWFAAGDPCSVCGSLQDRMPLRVRTWTWDCGTTHDRGVNAARDILAAGLAVSACGAGVGPQRSSPGGQSAMKQEALRREP